MPSLKSKQDFIESLQREIKHRAAYLNEDLIKTIYFGGGTPSLLSTDETGTILKAIYNAFAVDPDVEITLEANPDTLSPDYLKAIRRLNINRLSIGIQSFFDEDLLYLGRKHNSQHAKDVLKWAKESGFENMTIDLIYGIPTLTEERWNQNIDFFFQSGISHLSAYALFIEPDTILAKQIQKGVVLPPDEDSAVRDYETLTKRASEEGFLHYEISNFCKPRCHSQHNSAYWNRTPYIGLGPSAHSFDGASRQWNVSNVNSYIRLAGLSDEVFEREMLTPEQVYDEYVMTSLRTMWGCDLKYMEREMGKKYSDYCLKQAQKPLSQKLLTKTNEFLYLNDEQMLMADAIAEQLFWD
jgi:putative oxygen-independent coproporphyrinogen III oxidase